ncbi:MAG: ornithine cyclodeaminase family protein [Rhodocyclales bacterium]|nr:ornithine cyclodeaminase family protein [Rhodocyclales bacterium]
MALFITEDEVKQLLTMDLALAAVESAHAAHAGGRAIDVPRQRTRIPTAALHILQGALLDEGVFGYKAYTTSRSGARFFVHLFDAATGILQAVIEADALGMMRTGAAGGVAAKWLARPDAEVAGVFGAGWQAQSQIEALCRVRPLRRVKVFSRDAEKRQAFCTRLTQSTGVEVVAAASAEETVRGSAIVVTITSAAAPLFAGEWLEAGSHVTAAGSNALIRREIDEKTVQRAALVCVDSRATALREAGDLLPALEKGRLAEGQLVELGEIVAGMRGGRRAEGEITLFESQGMAIQDLAVAQRVLAAARERGLGRELPY